MILTPSFIFQVHNPGIPCDEAHSSHDPSLQGGSGVPEQPRHEAIVCHPQRDRGSAGATGESYSQHDHAEEGTERCNQRETDS